MKQKNFLLAATVLLALAFMPAAAFATGWDNSYILNNGAWNIPYSVTSTSGGSYQNNSGGYFEIDCTGASQREYVFATTPTLTVNHSVTFVGKFLSNVSWAYMYGGTNDTSGNYGGTGTYFGFHGYTNWLTETQQNGAGQIATAQTGTWEQEHTFKMTWITGRVEFYVDGVLLRNETTANSIPKNNDVLTVGMNCIYGLPSGNAKVYVKSIYVEPFPAPPPPPTTGINISAFNSGNNTALSNWGVEVKNGTSSADYSSSGLSNSALLNSSSIPRGSLSIIVYRNGYSNYTTTTSFITGNETVFINATLSLLQQFIAIALTEPTPSYINEFTMTAANATISYSASTTTGTLLVPLYSMPIGAGTISISAYGYLTNITASNITGNTQINYTGYYAPQLKPSGIGLTVKDETTPANNLLFNVTLMNATISTTYNNIGMLNMFWGNASMLQGDLTLVVSSLGYATRNFYVNANSNTYTNTTAYLLATSSGSYIRFHVLTAVDSTISGVLISANRSIGGKTEIVQSQLTDASGTALFFLDPIISYTVLATKSGYNSVLGTFTPSQSDYTLRMSSSSTVNVSTQFSEFQWYFSPSGCGLTSDTTTFQLIINDSLNKMNQFGFNITANATQLYSGSLSTASGGSLTAVLNLSNYNGTVLTSTMWFNRTGYPLYSQRQECFIYSSSLSNMTLYAVMTQMRANICATPITWHTVVWCPVLAGISLVVMLLVGGTATIKMSFNGGGAAVVALMWLFVYMAWFPWQPAFILTLAMVGILVLRGATGG